MKISHTKLKATSTIFGTLGVLWLISLAYSDNSFTVYETLFRVGAGLIFIAFALGPQILFQSLPSSVKEAGSRPHPFNSPLVSVLSKCSQLCLLLAAIAWIAS